MEENSLTARSNITSNIAKWMISLAPTPTAKTGLEIGQQKEVNPPYL